jgi:hypothetical protein
MKAPLSSSSTSSSGATFCSSISKKARFSPLLLALALFLLCFSFLYGEDLKELLGRQAQVASQLIINSNSSRNNGGDEQPAAPPPGKHQTFQNSFQSAIAGQELMLTELDDCCVMSHDQRWPRRGRRRGSGMGGWRSR